MRRRSGRSWGVTPRACLRRNSLNERHWCSHSTFFSGEPGSRARPHRFRRPGNVTNLEHRPVLAPSGLRASCLPQIPCSALRACARNGGRPSRTALRRRDQLSRVKSQHARLHRRQRAGLRERRTLRAAPVEARAIRWGRGTQPAPGAPEGLRPARCRRWRLKCVVPNRSIRNPRLGSSCLLGSTAQIPPNPKHASGSSEYLQKRRKSPSVPLHALRPARRSSASALASSAVRRESPDAASTPRLDCPALERREC